MKLCDSKLVLELKNGLFLFSDLHAVSPYEVNFTIMLSLHNYFVIMIMWFIAGANVEFVRSKCWQGLDVKTSIVDRSMKRVNTFYVWSWLENLTVVIDLPLLAIQVWVPITHHRTVDATIGCNELNASCLKFTQLKPHCVAWCFFDKFPFHERRV